MGDESGEPLNTIINRKEIERSIGDGLFMWGIGNALGDKIWSLLETEKEAKVLFSKMKSSPKKDDVSPDNVVLWTAYIDRSGALKPLPKHVFLTSRGTTKRTIKKKHYALVCKRDKEITLSNGFYVDHSILKNINSIKNKLGFSQVTAVVEKFDKGSYTPNLYPLIFSADLVAPYYVTLANPVDLPLAVVKDVRALFASRKPSLNEWMVFITSVKNELSVPILTYQSRLF